MFSGPFVVFGRHLGEGFILRALPGDRVQFTKELVVGIRSFMFNDLLAEVAIAHGVWICLQMIIWIEFLSKGFILTIKVAKSYKNI